MDRQRIEGGLKKTTGTIKEQAGKVIGDRHLQAEGKAEKIEGRIRSGVGKAMDAVRVRRNDRAGTLIRSSAGQ
jgi:uncharacterized protein YjbJ (UPF0337 family)